MKDKKRRRFLFLFLLNPHLSTSTNGKKRKSISARLPRPSHDPQQELCLPRLRRPHGQAPRRSRAGRGRRPRPAEPRRGGPGRRRRRRQRRGGRLLHWDHRLPFQALAGRQRAQADRRGGHAQPGGGGEEGRGRVGAQAVRSGLVGGRAGEFFVCYKISCFPLFFTRVSLRR